MRSLAFPLPLAAVLFLLLPPGHVAGQATAGDVRVISPGVVYNAGLLDLAAAYTKETGTKVSVTSAGMGRIVNDIRTVTPPPDVVMLPFELMSTLALDGGIKPGSFTPLGRSEMGLAVRAGAPHPDISTVDKLAAALRSAKAVMRSNPAGGSMVARVIEQNVIKRPEFAGVNSPVSTSGEGGQALARGEGDMALQAICEILPYKEIELVGALPRQLAAWIDMATAVSARSTNPDASLAFIRYIMRPEAIPIWKTKGLERFDAAQTTGSRRAVRPEKSPNTGLPFSPGILVGNTLYISGHLGRDPVTSRLVAGGIEPQTRQALANIRDVLRAAGMDFSHVTSVTAYIASFDDFATFNAVYRESFPTDPPARATVQVAALNDGARIELQMIAVKP